MTTLLTVAEARERLRMGRNQFYEIIKQREIAVIRRGRKILIPEPEIDRIIRQEIIPAKRAFFKSHRSNLSCSAETR